MKKLILIGLMLFCLTGCYDYQELNNRAIVSGTAIDFENGIYTINYEILDSKEEQNTKGYLVEGKGKTIVEAFENASEKIDKETYLSHLKVLVISEKAAEERISDISDYMLRDPNIRSIFTPVVAKGCPAKELLGSSTEEDPVVSEKIDKLIQNNKYNEYISTKIDFEEFMDRLEDDRIDASITAVEIVDEKISLAGIAVFEDQKLKDILTKEQAAVYNVLMGESTNHNLELACEEKDKEGFTIINLYNNKNTDFEIDEKTIKIKSNLNATVIKDSCGNDFRDTKIYNEFAEKFAKELEKEYKEFWKIIQKNKTDIIGIQKKYYQKTKKELENWQDLKLEIEVKIEINKNGLTFEVKSNE